MRVVMMSEGGCELRIRDEINYSLCVDDEQLDSGMLLQVADVFFLKSGGEGSGESRAGEFCDGTCWRKESGQPESLQRV
jgi:hypothetical protein